MSETIFLQAHEKALLFVPGQNLNVGEFDR
jgi:hypothetical protein